MMGNSLCRLPSFCRLGWTQLMELAGWGEPSTIGTPVHIEERGISVPVPAKMCMVKKTQGRADGDMAPSQGLP